MGIPWEAMSDREKAAQFAAGGDPNTLRSMVASGRLDGVPETELRDLVATSYETSARLREEHEAAGKYSVAEWTDHNLAETGSEHAQKLRARALEIKLNPNGEDLKGQVKILY